MHTANADLRSPATRPAPVKIRPLEPQLNLSLPSAGEMLQGRAVSRAYTAGLDADQQH